MSFIGDTAYSVFSTKLSWYRFIFCISVTKKKGPFLLVSFKIYFLVNPCLFRNKQRVTRYRLCNILIFYFSSFLYYSLIANRKLAINCNSSEVFFFIRIIQPINQCVLIFQNIIIIRPFLSFNKLSLNSCLVQI